jgi:hypothetical protein
VRSARELRSHAERGNECMGWVLKRPGSIPAVPGSVPAVFVSGAAHPLPSPISARIAAASSAAIASIAPWSGPSIITRASGSVPL